MSYFFNKLNKIFKKKRFFNYGTMGTVILSKNEETPDRITCLSWNRNL